MRIIITEEQEDLLMKSLPISFRRRFNYNMIKSHLEFTVLESVNPCEYEDVNYFIKDVSDIVVEDILDDYYAETIQTLEYEVKNELYDFIINNFEQYLRNFYKQQCAQRDIY